MKQIRLFLILTAIMTACSNCTFHKTSTSVYFDDLDIHIQDTLRNLPIDTFGCYPDFIDLTGHYKLIYKEIGPWTYAKKLENLETGKSYWLDYNTPSPIVVTSKEIIYPVEYNIITKGVEKTDAFNLIKIY